MPMPTDLVSRLMPSARRVQERRPSAPTTRSYRPVDPSAKVTSTPSSSCASSVNVVPSRTLTPTSVARSTRIFASSGRGMPMTAGRSGPPVLASGTSNSTVPAGSGARKPVTSKAYPCSSTCSHTPRERSSRSALPCSVMPEPRAATSGLMSTRSTATPRVARWMATPAPARPAPTTRTLFTAGMAELLLHGDRVDRGADGAGHEQGRGGEPEVVAAVVGAVGGQGVEVPQLAEEKTDVRDGDLVQWLEGDVELVRTHLEAPGVGGDAGDLGAVQPVGGGEREPGRRAAGVVAPPAALADVAPGAGQL